MRRAPSSHPVTAHPNGAKVLIRGESRELPEVHLRLNRGFGITIKRPTVADNGKSLTMKNQTSVYVCVGVVVVLILVFVL